MPEIINGNGTTPAATRTTTSLPPTAAQSAFVRIDSTSNTTPVVVTTDTAHGFYSGDTVELEGCSSLSGVQVITVTGAETYTINNSTAPGWVGGSTNGYCADYEVQPAYQVPNPGEPASMATLAPILQGLMNADTWLYRRTGKRRTHQVFYGAPAGAPVAYNQWVDSGWPDGNANAACITASHVYTIPETAVGLSALTSDLLNVQPASTNTNDELDISYSGSCLLASGLSGNISGFMSLTLSDGTSTVTAATLLENGYPGGIAMIGGTVAAAAIPQQSFVLRTVVSVKAISSYLPNLLTGAGGHLSIGLAFVPSQSDASAVLYMVGPANLIVIQRRPN